MQDKLDDNEHKTLISFFEILAEIERGVENDK